MDSKEKHCDKQRKIKMSALNGKLRQQGITEKLSIILKKLPCYSVMKINTTGMDLSFG